jgi:general stress protein 26
MTTDANLNDIREKIYKLRTAIMYSMSSDLCTLPNSIVTAVHVDGEGHLWFFCQIPVQKVSGYENSFPVRLHFYRKGILFHLEVSGKATIIDEAHCDYMHGETAEKGKLILIKMTMNSIEYTEPYGKKERSRFEVLVEKGYKWVLRSITIPQSKQVLSKWQSNY